jgi:hypothetical protein
VPPSGNDTGALADAEVSALLIRNSEMRATSSVVALRTADAFARLAETEDALADTLEQRVRDAPESRDRLEPLVHHARQHAARLRRRHDHLIHQYGAARALSNHDQRLHQIAPWPARCTKGRTVDNESEPNYLQLLGSAVVVEVAVGVVMHCLDVSPVAARRYLVDRTRRDLRAVDELAGDVVRRRGL